MSLLVVTWFHFNVGILTRIVLHYYISTLVIPSINADLPTDFANKAEYGCAVTWDSSD